jgi:hypothetical protein
MRTTPQCFAWIALVVATGLGAPAVDAEAITSPVATVNVDPSGISWQPRVENEGAVVTISGGDQFLTLRFEPGQRPSFSGLDNRGRLLPDGTYTWELALNARPIEPDPSTETEGAPDHNGRTGQHKATVEIPRQSGAFTILAGSFVDSDRVEAAASPDNN